MRRLNYIKWIECKDQVTTPISKTGTPVYTLNLTQILGFIYKFIEELILNHFKEKLTNYGHISLLLTDKFNANIRCLWVSPCLHVYAKFFKMIGMRRGGPTNLEA